MDWERATRVWSLGTPDRREAERLLHQERVKTEKRHHGLLPPQETVDAASVDLNDLLQRFLASLRETGRSLGTVKKYGNMRVMFARCGWRVLSDVSARSFNDWQRRSPLSGKTVKDFLKNTQGFMRWLCREKLLLEDPLEFVQPAKFSPEQFRRAVTPEQLQRLLHVVEKISPRRAVVYLAAVQLGLRRKELQGLTLADFEFDTPQPFVRLPASISKNRKEATLQLRPEVVAAVRSILPADASPTHKVFAGFVPRISRFKKDLALAAIPFLDAKGRRFDFHALRVTLGSNLLATNTPLAVIKLLMRHSDIRTTIKHYGDASLLPVAAAIASLPAFTVSGTEKSTVNGTETGVAGSPAPSSAVARECAG
jgi:integrase